MTKAKFAPSFEEDIAKAFEWWEAEHDRAAWENDQIPEEEKKRYERAAKSQWMEQLMVYWENDIWKSRGWR